MAESRVRVIRCQHKTESGKLCNNVIGVCVDDVLTIRRHGREVTGIRVDRYAVIIRCEKCGKCTEIRGKEG